MEPMSSDEAGTGVSSVSSRACDNCRTRKVRCDKRSPCSSCKTLNAICRTTVQRDRTQKQRVLISSQYENKIDRIEERLAAIERILHTLAGNQAGDVHAFRPLPGISAPDPSPGASVLVDHQPTPLDGTPSETATTFEGETSLSAHSAYASEFVANAVKSNPITGQSPQIISALSSLREIVNRHQARPTVHDSSMSVPRRSPGPRTRKAVELPPMDGVLAFVRRLKADSTFHALSLFPLVTLEHFVELCKTVYFNVAGCSTTASVLFHGCLYLLLVEYNFSDPSPQNTKHYLKYLPLTFRNLDIELANLDLLLPASEENIKALIIGAMYAIEVSKPTVSWNLTTAAASMCLFLGYHRVVTVKDDTPEDRMVKMSMFYAVYILDKTLSLRLGRASTIQDYDINFIQPPSPYFDENQLEAKMHKIFWCWVQFSSIQGRVYELLYSQSALANSTDLRVRKALDLIDELNVVRQNYSRLQFTEEPGLEYIRIMHESDNVTYYGTLTMIYRVIPPGPNDMSTTFNNACIDSARAALQTHKDVISSHDNMSELVFSGYIHWTILHLPCTSFMVLFCHIVSTGSPSDLQLLEDFVTSLNGSAGFSEGVEKMQKLFGLFLEVAKLYNNAKMQESGLQKFGGNNNNNELGGNVGNQASLFPLRGELDPYLNALGLGPPDAYGTNAAAFARPPDFSMADVTDAGLESWFSGNQHIFGLLEDDLSYIPPMQ